MPKSKPILIGILYRPPDSSGFLKKLNAAISKTKNVDNQEVFILGDLNIDLTGSRVKNSNGIKRYKEFCSLHGLEQLIQEPTRITEKSETLLDHIISNSAQKVSQYGVLNLGLSDHHMIYCTRKSTKAKSFDHKHIKIRSMKNYNKDLFLKKLKLIKFPKYFDFIDINAAYSHFIQLIVSVIDEIAPLKEIRVRNNTQEWMDEEVLEGIRIRDKLLSKFKRTKSHTDHVNFKKSRNNVLSLIKKKKKNCVIGKLNENIGKPKELWKSLKSLGLPSKQDKASKICLKKDGQHCFDDKTNSNIFKNFFSNLATELVKKLPDPPCKFGIDSVKNYYKNLNLEKEKFTLHHVNHDNVLKLLEGINPSKAAGPDNLEGKFLKDGASILATPVTELCNLSISLASFPDDCKQAKMKPLFKKGSKDDPKNYRPISLLPQISKVIEKLVHEQVQEYLDKNKILYRYQSGFRPFHSTDTCLSYLSDKIIQGLENSMCTGMILIDLQKAFDTIDHEIFLEKMKYLGFADSVLFWFRSYLTKRTFYVNIGKDSSSPGELSCGVPQGSILGPLIFLLYVNDMPQSVDCDLLLHADDSCLVFRDNDVTEIEKRLNRNFNFSL